MNHFRVMIATALVCVAVSAQTQTAIKPASIYDQDGITVVSPNQPGWLLLKTGKSETVFEKRDESGIFHASVKIIRTKTFETEKDRLTEWEALKQEEFSKFKQDHLHFNYAGFKGAMCLRYDAIFPLEKTASNIFSHFNVKGYVLPFSDAKSSAVQIEFFQLLEYKRNDGRFIFSKRGVFRETDTSQAAVRITPRARKRSGKRKRNARNNSWRRYAGQRVS